MGELAEGFASYADFGPLVRKDSIFQMIAESAFHPIHGGFRKVPAMVAAPLFPLPTAVLADFADRRVTRQRTSGGVAVTPNLRVPTRRDDREDATFLQGFVGLALVIGSVAIKSADLIGRLIQQVGHLTGVVATVFRQGFDLDLVRVGIHRQMQLSPHAAFVLAVFAHLP
jgi:hypothetical protein